MHGAYSLLIAGTIFHLRMNSMYFTYVDFQSKVSVKLLCYKIGLFAFTEEM